MYLRRCQSLDRMRSGDTINSFKLNLDGVRVAQLVSLHKFDLLWIDMEHTPNSIELIEKQVMSAKSYNCDIIVRVKKGSYSDMIQALEMDAAGIMIPHVKTAQEAREIAKMTKFYPIGRRPADGGNADGAFSLEPFADYVKFVNENRMVIIQIEDPEAMDELDEIGEVPGIDMLFFGPGDFSHAIGELNDFNTGAVIEARKRVARVAKKNGKLAGTIGTPDTFKEYSQMGYQLINIGADVIGLHQYCQVLLNTLQLKKGDGENGK